MGKTHSKYLEFWKRQETNVNKAHEELQEAYLVRNQGKESFIQWEMAAAKFKSALDQAYPTGFFEAIEKLKKGNKDEIELILGFLEADPYFFRSGYTKEKILRGLKKIKLEPYREQIVGLIVKKFESEKRTRELTQYANLARYLNDPRLQALDIFKA